MFSHLSDFNCRNAVSTQYLTEIKPYTVMRIWKATVQHKIYKCNCQWSVKWNPRVDVGYTTGLQLGSQIWFYFLFDFDKNDLINIVL